MTVDPKIIEAALQRGVEATGLSKEVFFDKYSAKLKVNQEKGMKPYTDSLPNGRYLTLSVEEMTVNQIISAEKAPLKGATDILFHLESQDDVALTKTKKPYSRLHIIVPVGNNQELFHGEDQTDGYVKVRATHWSDKSYRAGFYRAKISKKMNEWNGRMIADYTLTDIGPSERSFEVPTMSDSHGKTGTMTAFRILSAFDAIPALRMKKDANGQGTRGEDGKWIMEQVFVKRNGVQTPMFTRTLDLLVLNSDNTKSIKRVSTVFDEWMKFQIDPTQTYKGIIGENGFYLNLHSPPTKSTEKIELDNSVACDVLADVSDLRTYINKFVKLQPMFADSVVEEKQNPEKGTKTAYTTITDMASSSISILGDPSVFDKVIDKMGKMSGTFQVIGKVSYNKHRDSVSIWAYAINDISKGLSDTPIKIDEGAPRAVEKTSSNGEPYGDAW